MLVTTIERNPFLGRILTGRIFSGTVKAGDAIHSLGRDGKEVEKGRVSKVLAFRGLERTPVDFAEAGDIVAIAGLEATTVADTLTIPAVNEPLPPSRSIRRRCRSPSASMTARWPAAKATRCRAASSASACCAKPKAMSRSRSPKATTMTASKSPAAANCSSRC